MILIGMDHLAMYLVLILSNEKEYKTESALGTQSKQLATLPDVGSGKFEGASLDDC